MTGHTPEYKMIRGGRQKIVLLPRQGKLPMPEVPVAPCAVVFDGDWDLTHTYIKLVNRSQIKFGQTNRTKYLTASTRDNYPLFWVYCSYRLFSRSIQTFRETLTLPIEHIESHIPSFFQFLHALDHVSCFFLLVVCCRNDVHHGGGILREFGRQFPLNCNRWRNTSAIRLWVLA